VTDKSEKTEDDVTVPALPSEIAAAGLIVDVPMEASSPDPQRLQYEDLGPDKKWRRPDQTQDSGDNGEAQDPS